MEDQEIIRLYWNRDQNAINESEKRYGRYCYAISMRILRSLEDAQEIVNDTWLQAWAAMPPTWPDRLSIWLGRVTRNLSLNRLEKLQAQKRGGGEVSLIFDELENCITSSRHSVPAASWLSAVQTDTAILQPDEAAITRELALEISSWLKTLSKEKQLMFIGRYYYLTDLDTLSRLTGVRKARLSVTLHRVRSDLQQYLSERGYDV